MILEVGQKFDTEYEKGCKVLGLPDRDGIFIGLDSDGVECMYTVRMIIRIY